MIQKVRQTAAVTLATLSTLAARALPLVLRLAPVALFLFAGLALADAATVDSTHLQDLTLPTDPTDIASLASLMVAAVMKGRYGLAVSLGVTLLVAGLRKFVPETTKFGAWLKSRIGAIVMNFSASLGLAFSAVFMSGAPITVDVVIRAIQVALTAAGGWTIYKAIREELAERAAKKAGDAATEPSKVTENLDK